MCTDSIPKTPLGEGVCGDGSAELKEPEHHNRLKRPFEEVEEKVKNIVLWEEINSYIHSISVEDGIWRLASKFVDDPNLAQPFNDIMQLLKKEVITSTDAERFFESVSQLLENVQFLTDFYKESKEIESCILLCSLRTFGIITQNRVNHFGGKTEKIMSLIRKDSYFGTALKGEDAESDLRGLLSILIVYCISEEDLKNMGRRIGKVPPEVWVFEESPPDLFRMYGLDLDSSDDE